MTRLQRFVQLADRPHSVGLSFILHVVPGLLILLVYLGLVPVLVDNGGYPQLGMLLSFILVGVGLNGGFLLFLGKAKSGKWSWKGIVEEDARIPVWQYIVFPILMLAYALAVFQLMNPVSNAFATQLRDIFPSWYFNPQNFEFWHVRPNVILITLVLAVIVDGILHPIVEEYYFRGFLLPRLSRYRWFAPLINAAFFALFHLWQLQNVPAIFLMTIPWFYLIYWKRNIRLSIIIHCTANILGATVALMNYISS